MRGMSAVLVQQGLNAVTREPESDGFSAASQMYQYCTTVMDRQTQCWTLGLFDSTFSTALQSIKIGIYIVL